jgi:glycosyltransferase involved in cell wall biosynthesis
VTVISNIERRIKVYAALPVLNESENIFQVVDNLLTQEEVDVQLVICVNQPDEWWSNENKTSVCLDNQKTLEYLKSLNDDRISIIDKSSKGNGWIGKRHGVGWARKVAMDKACELANDEDIILSVDADTYYVADYVKAVVNSFNQNNLAVGFSAPYYHPLVGDKMTDICMLRYEIYMRNYALNMLLIRNPYAFSAIGSGMACTAKIYKKVRGLTPKMSGEDFYFIQKLRKSGNIIIDCDEVIYPGNRFSNRVYFGTGPAMIKGSTGDWSSYPVYVQDQFLDVKATFDSFEELFSEDISTPMDSFLLSAFTIENNNIRELWKPLRENCNNMASFVKAAMQKVDGLKVLQFLKATHQDFPGSDEKRLQEFILRNFNPAEEIINALNNIELKGFMNSEVNDLNLVRDFMFVTERKLQKKLNNA